MAETMSETELAGFEPRSFGESFYYYTAYGSPLAYARAIDLAAEHLVAAGWSMTHADDDQRLLCFVLDDAL